MIKRKTKYRAIKTVIGGVIFDSKGEAKRYSELVLLEKSNVIRGLKRQVSFNLVPSVVINGRKKPMLRYMADFVYFDTRKDCEVVEDFKGVITPEYRIKRHLMKHIYDIDILESNAK